jgi:amino acid transporter, AAT family
VTHLRFRQGHREEKLPFRMWGYPYTSMAGVALMSAALVTTMFTREFRPTLVYGVPFLIVLTAVYALRRGRAVAIAQPAVEETQTL